MSSSVSRQLIENHYEIMNFFRSRWLSWIDSWNAMNSIIKLHEKASAFMPGCQGGVMKRFMRNNRQSWGAMEIQGLRNLSWGVIQVGLQESALCHSTVRGMPWEIMNIHDMSLVIRLGCYIDTEYNRVHEQQIVNVPWYVMKRSVVSVVLGYSKIGHACHGMSRKVLKFHGMPWTSMYTLPWVVMERWHVMKVFRHASWHAVKGFTRYAMTFGMKHFMVSHRISWQPIKESPWHAASPRLISFQNGLRCSRHTCWRDLGEYSIVFSSTPPSPRRI